MISRIHTLIVAAVFLLPGIAAAFTLPADCRQLIVGVTRGWDDSHVTLTLYEKSGTKWAATSPSWPGRVGRDGLAWGRGLHPVPRGATMKREGDMKAPAGVFELGGVWGYEPSVRMSPRIPYRQVTPRDLWVEDPESPHYNRHLILPHDPRTQWEKKAQMKQNDPAHALKLFIAHNAGQSIVPGGGSAIFFHIWRANGTRPTAGCTTMDEARLRDLIARIDPAKRPLFVLLPRQEYDRLKNQWRLP